MTQAAMLLHDGVLLLADAAGDVGRDATHGLFLDDTRYLSVWRLTLDSAMPRLLASATDGLRARQALIPATRRGEDPPYSLYRAQAVDREGLAERLEIVNHRDMPITLTIGYEVDADFADQFELRTDRTYDKPGGQLGTHVHADGLTLSYRRGDYAPDSRIRAEPAPNEVRPGWLSWRIDLPPRGHETLTVRIGRDSATIRTPAEIVAAADEQISSWVSIADTFNTTGAGCHQYDGEPRTVLSDRLARWARHGLRDLAALRIPVPGHPEMHTIGAGTPWFLTLFGRDSLITAYAALPYLPSIAADTLRALAAYQGSTVDPSRAEEPGKIVHEVRIGELSRFGQVPYARYYGTVDATPLFLVLLAEYHHRTGDDVLVHELAMAARDAVSWMLEYGGLDRDGYLRYPTDGPGLVNHCWKDSPRAICHPSGEPALGPIAVCEAQGYAYHALTATAGLAEAVWRAPGYAADLKRRAESLRARFHEDFWTADEYVALALDGAGRQVTTVTSNPGHLLWSGILLPDHAERVADRLLSPQLLTRWGIRTMASGQPAYHPISYHNGGIWPHDTAIAAYGMARMGRHADADRVAARLAEATYACGYRLPEVLTGHDGGEEAPLPYPHACSPQAWAAASPLLLATACRLGPAERFGERESSARL
jgi:glycogen debranching enzyme